MLSAELEGGGACLWLLTVPVLLTILPISYCRSTAVLAMCVYYLSILGRSALCNWTFLGALSLFSFH